jgi:tripartite ATP-independent transporter DctP family solute receptor
MNSRKSLAALAAAAAISGTTAFAADYNLKVGVSTPEGYSWNLALAEFERQVEEGSNGAIDVTIFPSSQMGGEQEMARNVQLGTLEATVVSTSNISPFHPKFSALSVPYLFKSIECAMHVTGGEVGDGLKSELQGKTGIETMGYYTFGYRHLFNTKRPIESVSDVAGLKIRIPPDKYLEKTWASLGASPIPLPFAELFPALQQGVVDGDANPVSSIKQFKWYEVVDNVAVTNVAVGLGVFAVNGNFMKKLPAEYQELVRSAAAASVSVNIAEDAKATEAAFDFLKEQGVTFTHPDLTEFRAAAKPVLDAASEEFGAELIDSIVAAQGGC